MVPKQSRVLFVILAVLVLTSMACSLIGRAAEQVGEQVAEQAERVVEENLTQIAPDLIPGGEDEPDVNTPSEETGAPDASAGLESLSSYRAVFSIQVDGTDSNGQPQKGTFEIVHEVDRQAVIEHTRFAGEGLVASAMVAFQNNQTDIFNMEGATFMYSVDAEGKASCIGFSSADETPAMTEFLSLNDMVGSVSEARLVQRGDSYNGIQADHYAFDEAALFLGSSSQAKGDYWIAQDGGYLVKLHGEGDGTSGWFSSDVEGTYIWDYELSLVNEAIDFSLPPECEAQKPAEDIPVPDNALEEGSFGGMITFNSPETPDVVAEYYRQQLQALGWTVNKDDSLGDMVVLDYGKESRTLSIIITKDEAGGCSVVITETK
jgi:hypothetical protein